MLVLYWLPGSSASLGPTAGLELEALGMVVIRRIVLAEAVPELSSGS